MTIESSDITFTYSGGSSNTDPNESLGGESSSQVITSQRLFSDVTPAQSTNGLIDYRCFYLHNEHEVDSLYECVLEIASVIESDVDVTLGIYSSNERQTLTILNATFVSSGSFVLTYTDIDGDHDLSVNWNSNFSTWASNLQTAIRSISNLENVTVSASTSGLNLTFEIDFVGSASKRYHDLLVIKTNSLFPTTSMAIIKSVNGGPINNEAPEIDVSTTAPTDVTFVSSQVSIGDLRPLDQVPVWIKRTVPANAEAVEDDGFTFRLAGNPID